MAGLPGFAPTGIFPGKSAACPAVALLIAGVPADPLVSTHVNMWRSTEAVFDTWAGPDPPGTSRPRHWGPLANLHARQRFFREIPFGDRGECGPKDGPAPANTAQAVPARYLHRLCPRRASSPPRSWCVIFRVNDPAAGPLSLDGQPAGPSTRALWRSPQFTGSRNFESRPGSKSARAPMVYHHPIIIFVLIFTTVSSAA